jgi:metal-responsive CopG/Arc/MetJ family transcriptional regulator
MELIIGPITLKKIVSFSLSEESVEQIDKASRALGMSRSELIDFLAKDGFKFSDEVKAVLNEIGKLQKDAKERMAAKEESRDAK